MKTALRIIKWIVINAGFALLLWLWLARGVEGARHVAVFYIWFTFIVSLLMLSKKARESARARGKPPIPSWLDLLFDAAIASVLVWHGLVLLGALYLVHGFLMQALWTKEEAPA